MKPSYRPVRAEQTSADASTKQTVARHRAGGSSTAAPKRRITVPHPVTLTEPDETLTEMNVPTVEFVIAGQEEKLAPAPVEPVPAPRVAPPPPPTPIARQVPPREAPVSGRQVHSARSVHSAAPSASPRIQRSEAAGYARPDAEAPSVKSSVRRSSADRSAAQLYAMPEDEEGSFSDQPEFKIPIVIIIAGVLIAVAIIFLILFFRVFLSYEASRKSYQTLNEQLTWTQDTPAGADAPSQLDFNALLAQNPDTVAWLSMPGMEVSLPVVRNEDTAYYLTHGFDGTSNHNGCLFLPGWDKNNWTDGLHHVIYGHNIHDGTMFGQLTKYKDVDYFTSNPDFMLYTPEGDYRCLIFSVRDAVDSDENYIVDWQPGETYDAWLTDLKVNSLYDTGVDVPGSSQVITLSTCESTFAANDKRFVVHALMQKVA